MARGSGKSYRSARTGRYVTKATATRSPRTTVAESGGNKGSGKAYRSAISGRYVTKGTAQRHPGTTVTENG
ncbi:hypothetical protein [Nocardioides marmoraquaticus]